MKQFLVILRGVPASGKTTIAKQLCSFEKRIVWLKVDNFKDFFGDIDEALPFVNGAAAATLEYLLNQGFSIVMDGVFQDITAIDEAVELAKSKNVEIIVYELKCSLKGLQQRDKVRPGVPEGLRKALGDETLANIYHRLESSPYHNAQILDTEKMSLEECVNKIKSDLQIA